MMHRRPTTLLCLVTLLLLLPGVFATTIIYNTPSPGPGLNASVTAGTGILVTGNGSVILISFDTIWGTLQYYPYSTNPAGYLTNFTETDPIFTAENASIWAAINNISLTPGPPGPTGPQGPPGLDANLSNILAGTGVLVTGNSTLITVALNFTLTNSLYNDTANILFEPGSGLNAIIAKPLKGAGQIVLVNGSNIVTGIGTQFLGGEINTLDTYYSFYLGSQRYYVYPITSNTTANLTSTLFGPSMNWTQGNLTTDLVLMINTANGSFSRAVGFGTGAYGLSSTAFGYETVAASDYSTAFGRSTVANAQGATALGDSTVASGINSIALGTFTTASGNTAFASGQNSVARGLYATAMGYQTMAGSYAMATGRETVADAVGAFSMGYRTNTTSYADLAIGRYNVGGGTFNSWVATDPVFEIGMGTNSTNTVNALTVFKNGNLSLAGNMSVSGRILLPTTPWVLVDDFNMTVIQTSSTSSTVYSLVPNLTLRLQNASSYMVRCDIINDAAAMATGVQLRVNTTGSPSMVQVTWTSFSTSSAMEAFSGTSTSSNVFADTGSSTTAALGTLNSIVITSATESNWTVEMHSETANAARIEPGSYCLAVKVT